MSDGTEAAQRALNAARARQRRQALGPPLALTDADLDAIATVTPADVALSEGFVRDAAGQIGVDLLKATRDG